MTRATRETTPVDGEASVQKCSGWRNDGAAQNHKGKPLKLKICLAGYGKALSPRQNVNGLHV